MKTHSWLARVMRLAMILVMLSTAAVFAPGGTAGALAQNEMSVTLAPSGDADGSGSALFVDYAGDLCYIIDVAGIGDVVAAHIHAGAEGENGPVVVDLAIADSFQSGDGSFRWCVTDQQAAVITAAANPAAHYLNVHTTEYPAGAVRGQLNFEGKGVSRIVPLQAVFAPSGDPDGGGGAGLQSDPLTGYVCAFLSYEGIAPATAAHVHVGAAGENGPVLIDLQAALGGEPGTPGCFAADLDAIAAMHANPAGYYVNVHNAEHPAGAIRGQLASLPAPPSEPPGTLPTDPPPVPPTEPAPPAADGSGSAASETGSTDTSLSGSAQATAAVVIGGPSAPLDLDLPAVDGLGIPNATASRTTAELAFTGPTTPWLANAGLGLLAAGFVAMGLASRRRRS